MTFAEFPNSLAIAVISDTWRVERLFNSTSRLTASRPVVPIRLDKLLTAVFSFYAPSLWKSAVQGSDYVLVRKLALHCEKEGINLADRISALEIISKN